MDRRTPRVEGRRSGARAIDKNTSLRYEWPELMISQRDGYHHEAHSYSTVTKGPDVKYCKRISEHVEPENRPRGKGTGWITLHFVVSRYVRPEVKSLDLAKECV
jgi:hypothetical protein